MSYARSETGAGTVVFLGSDQAATLELRARFQLAPHGSAGREAASLELNASNYARRALKVNVQAGDCGDRIVLRVLGNDDIRAHDGNIVESFTLDRELAVPDSAVPESTI